MLKEFDMELLKRYVKLSIRASKKEKTQIIRQYSELAGGTWGQPRKG